MGWNEIKISESNSWGCAFFSFTLASLASSLRFLILIQDHSHITQNMPPPDESKPLLPEIQPPSYSFVSDRTELYPHDPNIQIDIESENEIEVPEPDAHNPQSLSKEVWILSKAAAPCISSSVLQFANKFTTTLFVRFH